MISSSSGTSDNGDKSLANKSGGSDCDAIDTEKLTRDSGRDKGERGDEGRSISTSKLLSRSLLREDKCMRRIHFVLHRGYYRIDRNGNGDDTRRGLDPVDAVEPRASPLG